MGLRTADILGHGWVRYMHPDNGQELMNRAIRLAATMKSPCPVVGLAHVKGPNGDWLPVRSRLRPILTPAGEIDLWVGESQILLPSARPVSPAPRPVIPIPRLDERRAQALLAMMTHE